MKHDYGRFVWFERVAEEGAQGAAFYGEVFGWGRQEMTMGDGAAYEMIKHGDAPVGGYVTPKRPGLPAHWASYVSVPDVDAAAKKVEAAGGSCLMEAFDAKGVGRIQPVEDAQGAVFLLFHAEDGDVDATTGPGSFHWNELWAAEASRAVGFYTEVLGYEVETMEMPNGRYHVLKNGDTPRAGIMTRPDAQIPPHWVQYVEVEDADAAVARAKTHGGEALGPLIDVDSVGRFGLIRDPAGATIGVIKPFCETK